jgi:hypothetical protein
MGLRSGCRRSGSRERKTAWEGAEFKAEVKRVSGEDAQLLLADEAEQILKQILLVSPAIQDFTNGLMKKYLGR